MKTIVKTANFLLLLSSILFLFACGGGGGGSSSGTTGNTNSGGSSSGGSTGGNTSTGGSSTGGFGGSSTGVTTVDASLRAVSSGDVDLLLSSIASSGKKSKKSRLAKESLTDSSFSDARCLIYVAKLSDISYTDVVAIVKTDEKGSFEIVASDVFDYLKAHIADVGETSDFTSLDPADEANRDRILNAYKKLGVLRLKAFYKDGEAVVSMEFFRDVTNEDPNQQKNADPRDRILIHWVEKVFKDLGIVPTEEQFEDMKTQIEALKEQFANFELPQGVTIDQFAKAFQEENGLILTDDQKKTILDCLASTDPLTAEIIAALKLIVNVPHKTVTDPITNVLNSQMTGLISNIGNKIQEKIDEVVNNPDLVSSFKILLSKDGNKLAVTDSTFKDTFNLDTKRRESLMRFFIALGFPVVVEKSDGTKGPKIAIAFGAPADVLETQLPGTKHFDDRNIRAFRVSGLTDMATKVNALFTGQAEVDALALKPIDQLSNDEYSKMQRLRTLHEFARRLTEGPPVVSYELIEKIAGTSSKVKLKSVASTLAEFFVWRSESIVMVKDPSGNEFPVFTGGLVPPSTGETPNPTNLLRKLNIQLGADPISAVNSLTNTDNFMFQFLGFAIEEALNRSFAENKEFKFPTSLDEARQLVKSSFSFARAKKDIERGMIAAFPPPSDASSLYGKLLSGDTELNARSAIFFVNFLLQSQFLIDSSKGFIDKTTFVPNFQNVKFLHVKNESTFSLAKFAAKLLSLTEFSESAKFTEAVAAIKILLKSNGAFGALYHLPEFREDVPDNVTQKANITAEMSFEFFDKKSVTDINALVSVQAVSVVLGPNGPTEGSDAPISGTITALDGNNTSWKVSFSNVPTNKEYFVFIKVDGYQNKLPELFFYADGFADPLNIHPGRFVIPPDGNVSNVPCIGLLANQQANPGGATVDLEGADFSNFEQGLPFILPISQDGKEGAVDLRFALLVEGKYSLETTFPNLNTGASDSKAKIAPLFVNWSGAKPEVGIKSATGFERLTDPSKAAGLNFLTLINSLKDGDMSNQAILSGKDTTSIESFFKDGPPLYLLKDRKGLYWLLSVEHIDNTFEPGFVDICFVRIGSDGKIKIPEIRFDQEVDLNAENPCVFMFLHYGDFAHIPSKNGGGFDIARWGWSAPKEVPFGYDATVAAAAQIRYAGENFADRVGTGSQAEIDALLAYIDAEKYSDIPSRLDYYGPAGGGLAVAKFAPDTKTWTDLSKVTYGNSVSNLASGDLVLIRFASSGSPDLVAMVEKMPSGTPEFYFTIGLVTANYGDKAVQVNGVLVDADKDGYIAKFDPNDNDANIKPVAPAGEEKPEDGSSFAGPSHVTGIFAKNEKGKIIFAEINEYMEEVYQITLKVKVKHKDNTELPFPTTGEAIIIEVTPPDFSANSTNFEVKGTLKSGSSVELDDIGFENANIQFKTSSSQFEAGGLFEPESVIDFEYEITFRPRDPQTGLVISDVTKFGTNPKRPSIQGDSELKIPLVSKQAGIFDRSKILIQQGGSTPTALLNGARLEPSKDIFITWDAVTNADFYEIEIGVPDIEINGNFLPGHHERFHVGKGERKITIPKFKLPEGRQGIDIIFIARRNNVFGEPTNDGAFTEFEDLSTSGEAKFDNPGDFGLGHELKIADGSKVYFQSNPPELTETVGSNLELFKVTLTTTGADITLASGVSGEGFLNGFDGSNTKKLRKQLKDVLADGSTFSVKAGSFFTLRSIVLSDGSVQPIDFNVAGIRDGFVRFETFMPPPFRDISSGGDFDINGDAVNDVNFNGSNILTFAKDIEVNRFDPNLGPVKLSTAGQATVYTIPAGTKFVDFDLKFADGRKFWFFIDLDFKAMEWGEIFGDHQDPNGGGDIFGGDLKSGESIDFDTQNFFFSISTVSGGNTVLTFDGSKITLANGWKLKDKKDGSELSDFTPVIDQPKVFELFNTSLNFFFDYECYLFASGELGSRILQPGTGGDGSNHGPFDPFSDPNMQFTHIDMVPENGYLNGTLDANTGVVTFSIATSETTDSIFKYAAGSVTLVNGWLGFDHNGGQQVVIVLPDGFAEYYHFEDTANGQFLDLFILKEASGAKVGILGAGGGGGNNPPPPNGMFQGVMLGDEFFNFKSSPPEQFYFAGALKSDPQDGSLFKFNATTLAIEPQNGWTISMLANGGEVPAPSPLIASSNPQNLKFKSADGLEVYLDVKLSDLDLEIVVMNVFMPGGQDPNDPPPDPNDPPPDPNDPNNPPPPTALFEADLQANQFFGYVDGNPLGFNVGAASVSGPTEFSLIKWDGTLATPENGWSFFDHNQTLLGSVTPTSAKTAIIIKKDGEGKEFDVDVYLDNGLLAIDVIGVIFNNPPPNDPNDPPPPPPNLFEGDVNPNEFFNIQIGAPSTFTTSGSSTAQSMFKADLADITTENGWQFIDFARNTLPSPLVPDANPKLAILYKTGAGVEIEIELKTANGKLHVVVITEHAEGAAPVNGGNDQPPPPPPPTELFNGMLDDTNKFLNIDVASNPPTIIASSINETGVNVATLTSSIEYNKATKTLTTKNGWKLKDPQNTELSSFAVPVVDIPHMLKLENSNGTIFFDLDFKVRSSDNHLEIKVLPPPPPPN